MEPQLIDRDGQPLALHRPTGPECGMHPGVRMLGEDESMTTRKADRSGIYTLNGGRFRIRKGDPLPNGAVMEEQRSRPAAPQTKARGAAPENRSKGAAKKDTT